MGLCRRSARPRPGTCTKATLWLAWMSAACGGQRIPSHPVSQVELRGVAQVDANELAAGLAHHSPEGWPVQSYASFDPLQLTIDRQRILSFYRARGFYSARLEDVEVDRRDDGFAITFTVDEGRPFVIGALRVTGGPRPNLTNTNLQLYLPFREGQVFQYQTYERAKDSLVRRLNQAGFAHAQVRGRVEVLEEDHQVAVHLTVDSGPVVRFGEVRIDAGSLPEAAVRARLAFSPGDVYDPALLTLTEARIYELGFAGVVTFYVPTQRDAEVINVGIRIKSSPRNELRLGGGLARQTPNYQMRFRAGYLRRDFFHPQIQLLTEIRPAVVYRPSRRRYAYGIEWSLSLTREDMLVPRLVGQAQVQYSLLQYEAYATLGPSFRLTADRPWLDDRLHLSVAVGLRLLGFPRVDNAIDQDQFEDIGLPRCDARCAASGTPGGLSLLYVEPAVTFDGRDDATDPTRGAYVRLHLEVGHTLNAPGVAWIRMTPEARGYTRLASGRAVLAARARFGFKLLPGPPLPATQRYFGGGAQSQRGFSVRQLSPFVGADSVPIGGEALIEVSTELRLNLFEVLGMGLGVVGFIDVADVAQRIRDIEWHRPHAATGAGLRLFTPIGPVRFDVGYRLNRVDASAEPGGRDRVAFHLSLGEAF